jgi:acyl-CoA reductase-like NAD-dependent aldehyde dehydrogenase
VSSIPVRSPRTGQVDYTLTPPSDVELSATAARLRDAQPRWQALGAAGRANALRAWAMALEDAARPLTQALVLDTGRRFESGMEAAQVAAMARRWADAAGPLLETVARPCTTLPDITLETSARPYPLVGVISPWNFPLLLALIDAIPALAAGCAVLIKPSEVTPRFAVPLRRTLARIPLLRDVVALVDGGAPTGEALVGLVDLVCFTGSVPTGRLVGAAAQAAFIPAFLELGGKDPAVVLADADLERAASALLWGSIANAGQSCLSIERVYVHEDVHDELVRRLAAKAEQVSLAYPTLDDGVLGPLIDPGQAAIIQAQLTDAVDRGARVRTGGHLEHLGGGHWLRPTVLTGVDHRMSVMREETFGPILPVMAFGTADEAVALANDSEFGLSAAVFSGDEERAREFGRRLDVGAVSVNDAALTALVHEGEKHSFRYSGLGGSRMGDASVRRFVRRQTLIVNHAKTRDPWWHTP